MSISNLKLQQLIYFCDAAETKSFTRTAENYYTSQSNISYAIRSLENSLGTTLFIRKENEVVLTSEGDLLLPYIKSAIAELENGVSALEDISGKLSGTVTLGYSYVFSLEEVPARLNYLYTDFRETGKNITIVSKIAHINKDQTCVDSLLANGECDLGITSARVNSNLEDCLITSQDHVLLVSEDHPLASRDIITLAEVKDEPFILLEGDNTLLRWYERMFECEGVKPKQLNRGMDWLQILLNVSAGQCMTIAMKNDYSAQKIKAIELDNPMRFRDVFLTWSKKSTLSNPAKYVRQKILEYYGVYKSL